MAHLLAAGGDCFPSQVPCDLTSTGPRTRDPAPPPHGADRG